MAEYKESRSFKAGDKLICKAKGDFEGKLVVLECKNTYGKWVYSTLPWSLDSRCGIWDHKECPNDFELYVETPVNHEVKPPLGLRPWNIADNERVVEILEAMLRYTKANKDIPEAWMEELVEKVSIEYE